MVFVDVLAADAKEERPFVVVVVVVVVVVGKQ
jgi:hypothetical protein